MFITPDELYELTGYRLPNAQRRWLTENGYPFDVSHSGKPKVLRSYLEQRLCPTATNSIGFEEPNFEALR